jgi:hypothetical protein
MNATTIPANLAPEFCAGIQYYGPAWPGFAEQAAEPAIAANAKAIGSANSPAAAYQTLMAADALRYLTLQICGAKASGHPGRFRLQRRGLCRAGDARPHQHRHRGRPPRAGLLLGDVPRPIAGRNGHQHRAATARPLPREARSARPSVRRHSRPARPRRPARPGPALRHGRRAAASRHAVPGDHRRRRHGRAVHPEFDDALQHRLSEGDQLPAGADLERLQPGTPFDVHHLEQRRNDGVLERPRLRKRVSGRCQELRRSGPGRRLRRQRRSPSTAAWPSPPPCCRPPTPPPAARSAASAR